MDAKRIGTGRAAVAALIGLAFVAVLAAGCGPVSPEAAVRDFLKARDSANWSGFAGSITPDQVRKLKSEEITYWRDEGLERMSQMLRFNEGSLKMKTAFKKGDRNAATVDLVGGKLTFKDPTGSKVVLDMNTRKYTYKDPATMEKKTMTLTQQEEEGLKDFTRYKVVRYKGRWYVDFSLERTGLAPTSD